MNNTVSPLSAEFLYELYAIALRQEHLCAIVSQHMRSEYLPDAYFQRVHTKIRTHFTAYKTPPSYAALTQYFQNDIETIELIETIKSYDDGQSVDVSIDMLESYIKGVRLQKVYLEVGKLYNDNKQ